MLSLKLVMRDFASSKLVGELTSLPFILLNGGGIINLLEDLKDRADLLLGLPNISVKKKILVKFKDIK